MLTRRILALASATGALVLTTAGLASAAGTGVTVRVEGVKRTLLAPAVVHTHAGAVKKGGAPGGSCPSTNAAGALDGATHGNWNGKYSSGLGIAVTTILGETHTFTSPYYWEIFLNNKAATAGICDLKLHRGDQLLFAPAPSSGKSVYPTATRASGSASTSHPVKLNVVYYNNAGKALPLGGARVSAGKYSAVTNRHGMASVKVTRPGALRFTAAKTGYIRSAVNVRVR